MRAPIAQVVSQAFYRENPLDTSSSVARRDTLTPRARLSDAELLLVDTTTLNPRVSRSHGLTSRLNVQHAQLTRALLDLLPDDEQSVALISPFAPQARLLSALVSGPNWSASTVHRFQGSEANTVVFDAVEARASVGRLHPWFRDGHTGSDGARLINVAASRARDRLIVIADMARITRSLDNHDPVPTFVRQIARQSRRIDWATLLQITPTVRPADIDPLQDCINAIAAASGPTEIFSRDLSEEPVGRLIAALPAERLAALIVWTLPTAATSVNHVRLLRANVMLRPLTPVNDSHLVADHILITASGSMLSSDPGTVIISSDPALTEAVRRVGYRREQGGSPASGQPATCCGTCKRQLVRSEQAGRSPHAAAVCPECDAQRNSSANSGGWRR